MPSPTAPAPDEFERWLRELCHTAEGPYLRPFAPNPEWRTAQVFVVGTNPATPLREEFDSFDMYWRGLTSDPSIFEEVYRRQHRGGESRTTARVRKFVAALRPLNVLVCNAYALPAPRREQIPNRLEAAAVGRAIFEGLFAHCRPRTLLFHGAEAVKLAEKTLEVRLDVAVPLEEQQTTTDSGEARVYAFPHFSGMGAPPGFAVGRMDADLAGLAARVVAMNAR